MGPKLGGERRLQVYQVARVFRGDESRPDRAEGNLYVEGCSVRPLNLPERAKNPLDGQTVEKFNLLIYWFQEFGITYPTLFMIKTLPE